MDLSEEEVMRRIIAVRRVVELRLNQRSDNIPAKIETGLFLGSYEAANNKKVLKNWSITHILSVTNVRTHTCSEEFICKGLDVLDSRQQNLRQHFEECFDFIDEARRSGSGVLVHCFVGKSRSVTIVVAYLMKKCGMSLFQALEHVKSKRPIASPNSGFISQLKEFEKSLLEQQEEENTKLKSLEL